MKRLLLLPLLAACAAPLPAADEVPANRGDVTASLYKQLELVLERQARLAVEEDPGAAEERAELLRRAAEIVVRIVRLHPEADVQALIERVERARVRTNLGGTEDTEGGGG